MPTDIILSYSLSNKARDLSSAMNTVIAGRGTFVTRFAAAARATNHKHEWLEDRIQGRGFTVVSYAEGEATLSAADVLKVRIGTRFRTVGSPAIFRVTAIDGVKITATVHSANGDAAKTALAAADACKIIATPVKERSKTGDGDQTAHTVGTSYNCTQIIRKDVGISRTAMQTKTIDQVENDIGRQTDFALQDAARDLNRMAIWGTRTEKNEPAGVLGEAGGLYFFAGQTGALVVDAAGGRLTSKLVNDAAEKITREGGSPTTVYCTPDQARVLANEYKNNITVMRDDVKRGVYVAVVVNEGNGQSINIIGDPDFDDADAFVADDACFGRSDMEPFGDKDTTLPGDDGISRVVLGEVTFEFRNALQRLCRIKALKAPAAALAEIANDQRTVNVTAGDMNVVAETVTIPAEAATLDAAALTITAAAVTVNEAGA